ncbi:hypothetical protein RHO12_02950 [Orbus sturtevantii]|uniref:hypothetical protein n=1 Tax=Orbus sturtevantii TaxID=3074109 RepID=UPI00370D70B4
MEITKLSRKYFFIIITIVFSYFITFLWLKGFDYTIHRIMYVYVFIGIFFALIAAILVHSLVSFKVIRLILYPIVGYMIGDILELVYIAMENPAQIKEFFKLAYHIVSINNLCWLQCLLLGVVLESNE